MSDTTLTDESKSDTLTVETNTNTPNVSSGPIQTNQSFFEKLSFWIKNIDIISKIKILIPVAILCIIGFLIWLTIRVLNPKFKEGFFGNDDPAQIKEQNSKQVKIDEVERQLQDRITNINANLMALKKRMDDADIVKDNKPTNLAIAIQNNILAVKEAMMKIIAGLVIQTKMNNGALNVVSQTNAFQQNINNSINNLINEKANL